ncbi:FecR family protein [Bacteroides nordii]|uniref:FecR family protein n=1 Tax=Bacteroides nordii TaxID=291645 RepID=UPI0026DA8EB3|nr:FecR family protein [Bacteroides nordii]
MVKNTKEDITPELIFRYCDGTCNDRERSIVEHALSESDELRSNIENLKLTLELTTDIKEYESYNVNAAYKKVWNKTHKRIRIQLFLMKLAAFITFPLIISTTIFGYAYFNRDKTEEIIPYTEIASASGTIIRHELPDKTIVWLNSGSRLSYPIHFSGSTREVNLEGEAYFEVHADKTHPFYVNTQQGMKVYAYGTKFNVNAYSDENFIETVLEKGNVNIIDSIHNKTITLTPGERLLYNKQENSLDKSAADIYEKTAWKEGKIIFRNTSLETILKRLARTHNVNIKFENKSGKDFFYRATFRNETITQILECLSESAKIKWEIKEPVQQEDSSYTSKEIIVTLYK